MGITILSDSSVSYTGICPIFEDIHKGISIGYWRYIGTSYRYNGQQSCVESLYYYIGKGDLFMSLGKNMSDFLRAYKKISGKSNSELAEEMQISRSILRDYLNGDGNPSLSTVEHLADKLKVDPVLFLAGKFKNDNPDIVLLLFNSVRKVIALPEPKRKQFVEHFLKMLSLFEDE